MQFSQNKSSSVLIVSLAAVWSLAAESEPVGPQIWKQPAVGSPSLASMSHPE